MSFQIANILEGCGGVQLNHITMHSSKEMTTITEGTLKKKIIPNLNNAVKQFWF